MTKEIMEHLAIMYAETSYKFYLESRRASENITGPYKFSNEDVDTITKFYLSARTHLAQTYTIE